MHGVPRGGGCAARALRGGRCVTAPALSSTCLMLDVAQSGLHAHAGSCTAAAESTSHPQRRRAAGAATGMEAGAGGANGAAGIAPCRRARAPDEGAWEQIWLARDAMHGAPARRTGLSPPTAAAALPRAPPSALPPLPRSPQPRLACPSKSRPAVVLLALPSVRTSPPLPSLIGPHPFSPLRTISAQAARAQRRTPARRTLISRAADCTRSRQERGSSSRSRPCLERSLPPLAA
jgi:hypothetical protein